MQAKIARHRRVAALINFQDIAIRHQEYVALRDADGLSEAGVVHEVAIVAVDGDKILGHCEAQHEFEVFLARVASHVNRLRAAVEDVRAQTKEAVNGASDDGFVAGDGICRDDHGVALFDAHLLMRAVRHSNQGGRRLALRTRRHNDRLLRRMGVQLISRQKYPIRDVEIAKFRRQAHVVHHAPADDRKPAPVYGRRVSHLLDAGDERGETGDNDAALRLPYETGQRLTDDRL